MKKILDYFKFMLEKVQPNSNLIRTTSEDKIQYFLIGERTLVYDFEVPNIFNPNFLRTIMYVPKSILQILEPDSWYQANIKYNFSSHVDLHILFDDYPLEDYDFFFNNPFKANVIFLNSHNENIFKQIELMNRFFLISSNNEYIMANILSSPNLRDKAFLSLKDLKNKILEYACRELNINLEDFNTAKRKRIEEVKECLYEVFEFTKVNLFFPSESNVLNICQLFSLEIDDIFTFRDVKQNERAEYLAETARVLGQITQTLKYNCINKEHNLGILNTPKLSTLIFSYPYFNPMYNELFVNDINIKTKKGKKDEAKSLKKVRNARFIEQDINTYEYYVDGALIRESVPILGIKQQYTHFLDFVGYLHSSFESSPFIRVPARGKSLNPYISRLSPLEFKKFKPTNSISQNLFDIGKALADNLPSKILNFLEEYGSTIFAISDLPIEWLLLKDTPLSFLCDICRIPETGLTSIIAQYNINSLMNFQIANDILSRTLVICGAKEDDSIFQTYKKHNVINKNNLPYTTAHIQTKQDFFELVNRVHPDLLIIDSHGNFKEQSEGSYIELGDEKLTGNDIVENLPQVPLVILSCCWGTPIYGNSNTIAQAFFQKGSFSVVSTFLPISVNGGFTFYYRVLNNLANAANNALHESWTNFISHTIRTSYIDNLFHRVMDKFGSGIFDRDKYVRLRIAWQMKCMDRQLRYEAYKETNDIVLNCTRNEYRSKVKNLLESSKPTPEFMLYTHLGRGDLVKFSSWVQKNIIIPPPS